MPNMGAPWRTDLQKLYRERLMKELEDGSIIVDWEEVENLMKKDADKISDMEYLSLIHI